MNRNTIALLAGILIVGSLCSVPVLAKEKSKPKPSSSASAASTVIRTSSDGSKEVISPIPPNFVLQEGDKVITRNSSSSNVEVQLGGTKMIVQANSEFVVGTSKNGGSSSFEVSISQGGVNAVSTTPAGSSSEAVYIVTPTSKVQVNSSSNEMITVAVPPKESSVRGPASVEVPSKAVAPAASSPGIPAVTMPGVAFEPTSLSNQFITELPKNNPAIHFEQPVNVIAPNTQMQTNAGATAPTLVRPVVSVGKANLTVNIVVKH